MTDQEWGRVIQVGTDLHRVVDEAVAALANADDVYQRGGALVHVVRDASPPRGVVRAVGVPSIRMMQPATLRERLTKVASFQRFDKRSEDWAETLPPDQVVQAVAMRGEYAEVRPLVGVLAAPALRPDGTVIDSPGYDASTGYLYAPDATYEPVPEHPTHADALRARDELIDVVCDFPFATPEHRSAWVAFVLTLFARPAIDGCVPLVAIDATTRGTGKGRLVDAASNIFTGRDATKTPIAEHDAEMRKRITSLVVEGESLACIDNVTGRIDLPSLDAVITSTHWKDRILGRTATAGAPHATVWTITGNNLDFGGDLSRRVLHVRLESPLENPEDRSDFTHHPLLPWVRQHRARLVRAALVILRAYFAAGRPDMGCKSWGSFEEWSALIANACVWVGLADPMRTRVELESIGDTAKGALVALLTGWHRVGGDGGISAKQAIAALYPSHRFGDEVLPDGLDDLREAVEALVPTAPGKPPSAKGLGYLLRQQRRRVVGGRMFDATTGHGGTPRWRVVAATAARDGGDGGDGGHVSSLRREVGGHLGGAGVVGSPPSTPSLPPTPDPPPVPAYDAEAYRRELMAVDF